MKKLGYAFIIGAVVGLIGYLGKKDRERKDIEYWNEVEKGLDEFMNSVNEDLCNQARKAMNDAITTSEDGLTTE